MSVLRIRFPFQSTPSAWRETICSWVSSRQFRISIHSLRMEGDYCAVYQVAAGNHFNPLPPHGGRPFSGIVLISRPNISIHSLRMEGDVRNFHAPNRLVISIHSLRMEGDIFGVPISSPSQISIHSLRMEGDVRNRRRNTRNLHFNPLPPHGGRRNVSANGKRNCIHFNPLPPHGGRHCVFQRFSLDFTISIHSLRMEGDLHHISP